MSEQRYAACSSKTKLKRKIVGWLGLSRNAELRMYFRQWKNRSGKHIPERLSFSYIIVPAEATALAIQSSRDDESPGGSFAVEAEAQQVVAVRQICGRKRKQRTSRVDILRH
jgi:hypothetical protein